MTDIGPGHNDQLRSIETAPRRFSKWENVPEHIRFFAKVIVARNGCHFGLLTGIQRVMANLVPGAQGS